MRLCGSKRKLLVHDIDEAKFEIARSVDYPNPVHLGRFVALSFFVIASNNLFSRLAVMALEDRGADKKIFIDLQEVKASIYFSSDS